MVCGLPIFPHPQSVNACALDGPEELSGEPIVREEKNQDVIHKQLQQESFENSFNGPEF